MKDKQYHIGMYGGKFFPFHKGHAYCIDTASSECDILYVPFFYSSKDEILYQKEYLNYKSRILRILTYISRKKDNIKLIPIDKTLFTDTDHNENWYLESKHIKEIIGENIDAVYSSEPAYDVFFKEEYPNAVHRLIDPHRAKFPISGTMIRNMKQSEAKEWIM